MKKTTNRSSQNIPVSIKIYGGFGGLAPQSITTATLTTTQLRWGWRSPRLGAELLGFRETSNQI